MSVDAHAIMDDVAPLPDTTQPILVGRDAELTEIASLLGVRPRPGAASRGRAPCCSPATPASARPGCSPSCATAPSTAGWQVARRPLPRLRRQRPALPARSPRSSAGSPPTCPTSSTRVAGDHPALARLQPGPPADLRAPTARPSDAEHLDRADLFEACTPLLERRSPSEPRCCWSSRTCTGPTSRPATCSASCSPAPFARPGRRSSRPTAPTTCTAATRCAPGRRVGPAAAASTRLQLDPLRRRRRPHAGRARCIPAPLPESELRAHRRARRGQRVLRRGAGRRRRAAPGAGCPTTSPTCCWSGSTGSTTTPGRWCGPPRVAGRRVSHELLAAVVGARPAGARRGRCAPAVEQQRAGRRSAATATPSGTPCSAEAVYDDLLPGERVRLHAAYAEALAQRPRAAAPPPSWPGTPGWPTTSTTALGASIQAGDEAMAVGGPDEAAQHYEPALELLADPRRRDLDARRRSTWRSRPPTR